MVRQIVVGLMILNGIGGSFVADAEAQRNGKRLFTNATLITMDETKPDSFVGYMLVGHQGRIVSIGAGKPPSGMHAKHVIDL